MVNVLNKNCEMSSQKTQSDKRTDHINGCECVHVQAKIKKDSRPFENTV